MVCVASVVGAALVGFGIRADWLKITSFPARKLVMGTKRGSRQRAAACEVASAEGHEDHGGDFAMRGERALDCGPRDARGFLPRIAVNTG